MGQGLSLIPIVLLHLTNHEEHLLVKKEDVNNPICEGYIFKFVCALQERTRCTIIRSLTIPVLYEHSHRIYFKKSDEGYEQTDEPMDMTHVVTSVTNDIATVNVMGKPTLHYNDTDDESDAESEDEI
jgi:uncharacterized protein YqkB